MSLLSKETYQAFGAMCTVFGETLVVLEETFLVFRGSFVSIVSEEVKDEQEAEQSKKTEALKIS